MLTYDDLSGADEVFLTNSSWGVLPVVQVEAGPDCAGGGGRDDAPSSPPRGWRGPARVPRRKSRNLTEMTEPEPSFATSHVEPRSENARAWKPRPSPNRPVRRTISPLRTAIATSSAAPGPTGAPSSACMRCTRRASFATCAGGWEIPSLAEDVLHDVFLIVLRKIGTYRVRSGVPFHHWLLRIATNAAHRELRRRRHRPAAPDSNNVAASTHATDERDGRIVRAVQSLPPAQQSVLILHYVEDLQIVQVASVLGCRAGTVKIPPAPGPDQPARSA